MRQSTKFGSLISALILFLLSSHALSPAEGQRATAAGDIWRDKSPHKSGFVQANGVRLHALDWGGKGKTMLFLADIGYSAHVFDEIAPKFTDSFHVIGLTRRGQGESEKPASGYDTDTLIEDIRQFLDKKGIGKVIIAGHGLAGVEMTRFATIFKSRVEKLVYFDAAYDSDDANSVLARYEETLKSLPPPPYPLRDNANFDALRSWGKLRLGCWSEAMEAELRADIIRRPDGGISDAMPARVEDGLRRNAVVSAGDFANFKAPALSFYAMDSIRSVFPWASQDISASNRKAGQRFADYGNELKKDQIARFLKGGTNRRAVDLPDTVHHCFIARQDKIVQDMKTFLSEK